MNFWRAVQRELARSLDCTGRTARRDYLCFLSASTAAFSCLIWMGLQAETPNLRVGLVLMTTALFYIPVTTAGVRRLHDTGETGLHMLEPLKPIATLSLLLLIVWLCVTGTVAGTVVGLISAMFFSSVVVMIASIAVLVTLFLTLASFSTVSGLLLMPAQPGPNEYGPNPLEVNL
jgi:uncharacterized membrane protein YhaH (DUF805 family)